MEKIIRKIFNLVEEKKITKNEAKKLLKGVKNNTTGQVSQDIAVIGMAGKFPQAESLDEYWDNLVSGRNCITTFPEHRRKDTDSLIEAMTGKKVTDPKKTYKNGGFLKQVDQFDAGFFRISPHEARVMEPSQRLFLETTWEAIEDAGLGGDQLVGSKTGIFVGRDHSKESKYKKLIPDSDVLVATGSWTGILASRTAYIFDFQGPSMVIDTACSSGLVALHSACQSLQNKECDYAIAGGVYIYDMPSGANGSGRLGMVESPDANVRSFDQKANGTVWGEGVGSVLLKPLNKALADGDPIHAVIKGSAINNDGASNGITAPRAEAQEQVILEAWKKADIKPESISYVEGHGTGTVLGDPIEIKGLTNAFRKYTKKKQFCGIGSCKTSIGHLVAASGIASFIKMVLCLKHGQLPASLNFENPNPYINFCESPIYVNDRLQDWNVKDYPRRGGISAYGFSGTNCHVVVEEAPEQNKIVGEETPQILTISGRSKEILDQFIDRYHNWVGEHQEMNLADFCYTVNTGRGHYSHRIAMIVKDREDLLVKLDHLAKKGAHREEEMGIYYSSHKVVNANKKKRQPGEISEGERRKLGKEAAKYLQEFIEEGQAMDKVAEIYTRGATVDWQKLYTDQKRQKLHLPTYPFERTRYWPDREVAAKMMGQKQVAATGPTGEVRHPLLHRTIVDSLYQKIYLTEFSVDSHWVLKEHRVMGNYVVPGTTYIEVVREAVKEFFPNGRMELRKFYFMTPLMVDEGEVREVQTILDKKDDLIKFTIASQDDIDEEWQIHAQGEVVSCSEPEVMEIDVEELKAGFSTYEDFEQKEVADAPIQLGQRWTTKGSYYLNDDEVLFHLQINDKFISDLEEYDIHPSMMDNAVNLLSQSVAEGTFLPFSYNSLKIYGKMPKRFYSHLRMEDTNLEGKEIFNADGTLFDESGRIFAEIKDYKLKKVRARDLRKKKNIYHDTQWIARPLTEVSRDLKEESILILADERGYSQQLADELRDNQATVFEAKLGDSYQRLDKGQYIIDGTEENYLKLFNDLKEAGLTMILHMESLHKDNRIEDIDQFKDYHQYGVKGLFYITRAFAKAKIKKDVELFLITEGVTAINGDEDIYPHNASLVGLGKVIGQEGLNLSVRAIDLDTSSDSEEAFDTGVIIQEIISSGNLYQTAFRQGKRYVEELVNLNLEEMEAQPLEVSEEGVYLITGGTGGIGLEVARFLAEKNQVNLALLKRSPLPERSKWEQIIADGENTKLSHILTNIKELEAEGATVVTHPVDVTSYQDMANLLDELRQKFGRINGIVHAAGVAGDGFIIRKDEEVFDQVLKPKVEGTWILDQLTRVDKPDFFVLCSSIATLMASAGQGDYVAANSYLDAYATYRKQQGLPTVAINWSSWKETGMAVDNDVDTDAAIFKGLKTWQAMMALEDILERELDGVVVGELNYKHQVFASIDHLPLLFSPDIKKKINKYQKDKGGSGSAKQQFKKIKLTGKEEGQFTTMEKQLGNLYGNVLGLDELDIYEDFYALGGDSIIAIKLANTIKAVTKIDIDTSDIFEHQTVVELAEFLGGQISEEDIVEEEKEEKITEERYFDLSKPQQRIWFLQKYNPEMTAYNMPFDFEYTNKIEEESLMRAMKKMIDRHSALRTVFIEEKPGVPKQKILPKIEEVPVKIIDLTNEEDPDQVVREQIAEENKQVFDLKEPLFKVRVYLKSEDTTQIYINIHHIVGDGWSIGLFLEEFLQVYQNYLAGQTVQLPKLTVSYEEWLEDQINWLESDKCKEAEEYWLEEIQKPLPVLNLPTDFPRPPQKTYSGSSLIEWINNEKTKQLKELAREKKTTMHMLLLSAYFLLLKKISQDQDIIIGVPNAGRDNKDMENIFGLFINMMPIRVDFEELNSLDDLLNLVKDKSLRSYKYGQYPFDLLVEQLNPERDTSRSPVFSTIFQYFEFSPFDHEGVSHYDLALHCRDFQEETEVRFEFNTDLFRKETIELFSLYYHTLLDMIIERPDAELKELRMISKDEREKVVYGFNDTEASYPANETLHNIFEEQVAKSPDNVALIYQDQTLTYQELNKKVNRLARTLREKGVKRDSVVGMVVDRSLEMMIGILAIQKAGGAYLPIGSEYPVQRISYMLEDSQSELVLTQTKYKDKIEYTGEILDLEDESIYSDNDQNLENINEPTDLAYVIYTSGSTGRPKGVAVEHHTAINTIWHLQTEYPIGENDKLLQSTVYTFDASAREIFWWFFNGASLCLLVQHGEKDPQLIVNTIAKEKITVLKFVPVIFNEVLKTLEEVGKEKMDSLRILLVGGEALHRQYVTRYFGLFGSDQDAPLFVNVYGPTETSIHCTEYKVTEPVESKVAPIGKPITNDKIYILDEELQPLPVGVPGEIYIGGVGVARGYYNNRELTQTKFLDNPFIQGERIYKSGDRGRWLADGSIEFLGRVDYQMKIRGNRIEPGEIESELLKNDLIEEAVIVDREDETGAKYLVAYYVANEEMTSGDLRDYLAENLPDYMIPGYFVQLDSLPLSTSGKINRKALPKPEENIKISTEYQPPRNEREEKLVDIWKDVLAIDQVGVNDSFFEIGGNSMKIISMVSQINDEFDAELGVVDLFRLTTISEVAAHLEEDDNPEEITEYTL